MSTTIEFLIYLNYSSKYLSPTASVYNVPAGGIYLLRLLAPFFTKRNKTFNKI
jgi:hypothetical protein